MKVAMIPSPHKKGAAGISGIDTVIRYYARYAEEFEIEYVEVDVDNIDLQAIHAGISTRYLKGVPLLAHCHGLYWSGDYGAAPWEWNANKNVIDTIRHAQTVTVPSEWVAETFQRDMRYTPEVVPHGVDWAAWQHTHEKDTYVIGFAKNRDGLDVCSSDFLGHLAPAFPNLTFLSTFEPKGSPYNVKVTGLLPYEEMRTLTQKAAVFISPIKETFGLHALEACAAGTPVLSARHGGVSMFVQHGQNGYLYRPGDIDDMAEGLRYCLKHQKTLGENGKEMAKSWSWREACRRLAEVYRKAALVDIRPKQIDPELFRTQVEPKEPALV
jgi:hypothetical protein